MNSIEGGTVSAESNQHSIPRYKRNPADGDMLYRPEEGDWVLWGDVERLVEQLEAAQAEAELKRIETHHANAKRQSIEEQLEAAERRADDQAEKFQHETLLSNRLSSELSGLRRQMEELREAGHWPVSRLLEQLEASEQAREILRRNIVLAETNMGYAEERIRELQEQLEAAQHRCVFPECVDGEKPARCGRCGDASRLSEVADIAQNAINQGYLHQADWEKVLTVASNPASSPCSCTRDGEGFVEKCGCPKHDPKEA